MNKKIGLVADLHIGCRGGSHVWRSFIKHYLIDYMIPTFKENNITDIIQLGDLLDVRRSLYGLDRHWIVNEFIPTLKENSLTFHTLVGNHDCSLKDTTSHSNWNLWAEAESGGCIKAYTSPQDAIISDVVVSICPWVSKENLEATITHVESSKAAINVGHWELESFLLSKGNIAKSSTFNANTLREKFPMVLSGHYHISSEQQGGDNIIKYLGTPYCLDWGSFSDNTEHGLYTIDTTTKALEFIPNPLDKTMFCVVEYDYPLIAEQKLGKKWCDPSYLSNTLELRDKLVRVEVLDKSNSSHYKKFCEALRLVDCVNYSTVDLTDKVETSEQEINLKEFKTNTLEVLLDKVDNTEGINHETVLDKVEKVYNMCRKNLIG